MDFKNNHDFITLFEKRLSEYTGAPYVVTTNCATSSLLLSMKCLEHFGEIIKGDDILIPSRTYISVPQVLRHLNYHIHFKYMEWSESYRIRPTNVWDCAVGFRENMYQEGTIQCLSFQQKKCINIGQGGAILLDDEEKYKYLKKIGWDGRDASIPLVSQVESMIPIELDSFHMYLSPDSCAKGVLLLNQLSEEDVVRKIGNYSDYPDLSRLKWGES